MTGPRWYDPADFFVLRAPLLPIDVHDALRRGEDLDAADADRAAVALAAAEPRLAEALAPTGGADRRERAAMAARRRYLIRMSTRPTPFGAFAGVAVGAWGPATTLQLSGEARPRRTRPDMGWLATLVHLAESDPSIRRALRVVANRTAVIRAGRVVLAERVSRGEQPAPPAVSIRATRVVRLALELACEPIEHVELERRLLDATPGATPVQIEGLLTALWEQTLLLTELRPSLTDPDPAGSVLARLCAVAPAAELSAQLGDVIDHAARADEAADDGAVAAYRALDQAAARVAGASRGAPYQVDSSLPLEERALHPQVGVEAARAAELLLVLSPRPSGAASIVAYRRRFEHRYGADREVPLLELLDPTLGLGPLASAAPDASGDTARRNTALLDLALAAARDGRREVELDDATIARLRTSHPSPDTLPPSLDLNVVVAAASADAIDGGDFRVIVAPGVGAGAAGRGLGRFAGVAAGSLEALGALVSLQARRNPGWLSAELSYQPRVLRLGNVSTRPLLHRHEIPLGVRPDPGSVVIAPDEIVVGIRGGRLYARWTRDPRPLAIAAGHMLNHLKAPPVARFLSEVGHDGECQLSAFQWGVAAGLAVLPRIRAGRAVLALAQWRLTSGDLPAGVAGNAAGFADELDRWRRRLDVPDEVYLSAGDNRLLLDLDVADHVEELRRALRAGRGATVLTEALPDSHAAWLTDDRGRRFMSEVVVPLVRRETVTVAPPPRRAAVPSVDRHHPLGGEWLYVKLYTHPDHETDLLGGPLRDLLAAVRDDVDRWFFLRYHDPDRHLRLRFHGRPDALRDHVLPVVASCTARLVDERTATRVAYDTYEPEIDRYGGPAAMHAAERFFTADSDGALGILSARGAGGVASDDVTLGALTVDAILEGLGMDDLRRVAWLRRRLTGNAAGSGHRTGAAELRRALARPADDDGPDASLREVLTMLANAAATYAAELDALEARGELYGALDDLAASAVHLHLNRLLGPGRDLERRVLDALQRTLHGLQRSGLAVATWRTALP